jgi:CheY-like chemotaxis protein
MVNKRILIIDDEPSIRSVVNLCLSEINDYEVIEAESGQEGLIKAVAEQPDAIVLDLCMPQMDGIEVLQRLKSCQSTRPIPVVILSAIAAVIDSSQISPQDVVKTIAKPFDPMTLGAQIATACHWG